MVGNTFTAFPFAGTTAVCAAAFRRFIVATHIEFLLTSPGFPMLLFVHREELLSDPELRSRVEIRIFSYINFR